MERKFSHIILSFLLLVSTIGVAVSKHYCGSSFISTSVFHGAKSCCDDSDCCHNEDQFFQVKDDFSAPVVLIAPALTEFDILGQNLLADLIIESSETETFSLSFTDSPPPPTIQEALALKQLYLL